MEDHHTEAILNLLKSWQTLAHQEAEAIVCGNTPVLEKLIMQTNLIWQRLERHVTASGSAVPDRLTVDKMKELFRQQAMNIRTLQEQADALAQEIGSLRKSRSSLLSYKQKKNPPQRFTGKRM
jgi:hypothetical protein